MKLPRIERPSITPKLPELPHRLSDIKLPVGFDALFSHGEAIVGELRRAAKVRSKDYRYDLDTIKSLVDLAGCGATLYLVHKRSRAALPASLFTTVATAGLSVAQPRLRARPKDLVFDNLSNAFATLSLILPKTRRELTGVLDLAPRDPTLPFTTLESLRNHASLYAAYTLAGHWAEMLFCQLIRLGIVGGEYDQSNEMLWDWWLHPFPAEGLAALFIALVGDPLRDFLLARFKGRVLPALALSFLATQGVCTAIDYLTGMVANRNYELWDYRDMPFNFQGQICLQNSLVYSTAATLITWTAYPARERWLRTLPADVANLGFSAFAPVYAFLSLIYFA